MGGGLIERGLLAVGTGGLSEVHRAASGLIGGARGTDAGGAAPSERENGDLVGAETARKKRARSATTLITSARGVLGGAPISAPTLLGGSGIKTLG